MRATKLASLALVGLFVVSTSSLAAEAGQWTVRAGPFGVGPKSGNSDIVSVDDGVALGFNFTYHFNTNWAFEVLASTPFTHDIDLVGGPEVADAKHLPPTFTLQYYFENESRFHPYVGLGLNWTIFFDESTTGPLAGMDLELDDSVGIAAQIGADIDISDAWFVNLDVRYIDIETDAELDGTSLGTVEIDPWVVGIAVGRHF